jgi:hypothetical protein
LAAIQCTRRWRRAKFGSDNKVDQKVLTDEQLNARYLVDTWDDG